MFLDSRIIFEEYIFDIKLSAFPYLRHVRVEAVDDVLESEYGERALLVIEGQLGQLKAYLAECLQVLAHVTVLLVDEHLSLAVHTLPLGLSHVQRLCNTEE